MIISGYAEDQNAYRFLHYTGYLQRIILIRNATFSRKLPLWRQERNETVSNRNTEEIMLQNEISEVRHPVKQLEGGRVAIGVPSTQYHTHRRKHP